MATTTYSDTGLIASTLYKWYIAPRNESGPNAACATTNATIFTTAGVPAANDGIGLNGDYYNNPNLAGKIALSRIDATINFDWGSDSPSGLIDPKTFSVRWTGQVQALFSETYTFYTYCDNGTRLWVNGQLLVDSWMDHAVIENSGSIKLSAGVKYDIKMEYYEKKGTATAKLFWSGISTTKEIIPQKQLFLPLVSDNNNNNNKGNRQGNVTMLYQNPISSGQNATWKIKSDKAGPAIINVLSTTGRVFLTEKITINKGEDFKTIHLSGLRPGMYIIHVSGNKPNMSNFKIVIN